MRDVLPNKTLELIETRSLSSSFISITNPSRSPKTSRLALLNYSKSKVNRIEAKVAVNRTATNVQMWFGTLLHENWRDWYVFIEFQGDERAGGKITSVGVRGRRNCYRFIDASRRVVFPEWPTGCNVSGCFWDLLRVVLSRSKKLSCGVKINSENVIALTETNSLLWEARNIWLKIRNRCSIFNVQRRQL